MYVIYLIFRYGVKVYHFEFIYGILIPLLVFTPVFISSGLIIDTITEEYERRTMELLEVAPVSFSQILNG